MYFKSLSYFSFIILQRIYILIYDINIMGWNTYANLVIFLLCHDLVYESILFLWLALIYLLLYDFEIRLKTKQAISYLEINT